MYALGHWRYGHDGNFCLLLKGTGLVCTFRKHLLVASEVERRRRGFRFLASSGHFRKATAGRAGRDNLRAIKTLYEVKVEFRRNFEGKNCWFQSAAIGSHKNRNR